MSLTMRLTPNFFVVTFGRCRDVEAPETKGSANRSTKNVNGVDVWRPMTKSTCTVSPGESTWSPTFGVTVAPTPWVPSSAFRSRLPPESSVTVKKGKRSGVPLVLVNVAPDGEGARRSVGNWRRIKARVQCGIQRDEVVNDREELKGADVTSGCAIPVAVNDARLAALVGEQRVAVSVGTHSTARINGRAARDKGMGLCRSAVEGQDGIEDVAELDACGRYDIGGTGSEAHHSGVAVEAKEVVVVGNDSAIGT